MKSIIKNKKGELSDMLIWLITIFILGIGFLVFTYVTNSITGGLRDANLNTTVELSNAIDSTQSIFNGLWNNGFMFLFFGLIASLMITSFLVRTHPIFLFLYIFVLAITLILGVYLGNAYYDLQSNVIFSGILANVPFINAVMNHIVEITLGIGALSMVIVFAKFSTFGGTQQY